MVAIKAKTTESAPSGGDGKNGIVVSVHPQLRIFDMEQLGFKEEVPGCFRKWAPGGESMNIDYRPTSKNTMGFPKGRLYVRTTDGKYLNNETELCEKYEPLGHHRLFQQQLWADEGLDGSANTEIEENVAEEIKLKYPARLLPEKNPSGVSSGASTAAAPTAPMQPAPSPTESPVLADKKLVEQVNREAHEQYGKKTVEDYKQAANTSAPPPNSTSVPAIMPQAATDQGQQYPAVQESRPKLIVGVNKGRATALKINGIEIPNDLIYWYGIKKDGVIVNVTPYVGLKCVEYLASAMDILYVDPRAGDPTVPVSQLTRGIDFEVVKNPWVENEWGPKGVAIVRGYFRAKNGQVYSDLGTATPENTNKMQKRNMLEQAIARAIVRAGRMATHCNLCSVEEADLEISGEKVLIKGGLPGEKGDVIDAEFSIISQNVGSM